jgi:hypothetical protein
VSLRGLQLPENPAAVIRDLGVACAFGQVQALVQKCPGLVPLTGRGIRLTEKKTRLRVRRLQTLVGGERRDGVGGVALHEVKQAEANQKLGFVVRYA